MHERSSRWRPAAPWPGAVARVTGGKLALPAELASAWGFSDGAEVRAEVVGDGVLLRRPVTHLAKVYVELTNRCNLSCRTCMRNSWREPLGMMSADTWQELLAGIAAFSPAPTLFFGGMGEPLLHGEIVAMVRAVKACGARAELITNGTLLDEALRDSLADAGLDMLWVSIDGATPEGYGDVRLGAALPPVLANLEALARRRPPRPDLGVSFVAMKRNIAELPRVAQMAERLGARSLLVTNVVPHTAELAGEMLSTWAQSDPDFPDSLAVSLPRLDANEDTWAPLYQLLRQQPSPSVGGVPLDISRNRCPFVEAGALAVRWDGFVSPCLPLLHDHVLHLEHYERRVHHFAVGRLGEQALRDLWLAPEYVDLRERLQRFEFAPCASCGGCQLAETNEEDCYGNGAPTCGGCLWAQGVIRCP